MKKLFLLLFISCVSALTQYYDHTAVLDDKYTLHWRVEGDDILIGVVVQTSGWVGFGIAEESSGSMPGADIFSAWVDANGHPHIQDRYSVAKSLPSIDECQDWGLVAAHEANGVTTVEVRRKLDTGDSQDRKIFRPSAEQLARGIPFATRIIYAYGATDTFGYHGPNRRATAVEFFSSTGGEGNEEIYTVDYRINNFSLLPIRTQYVCQTYFFPLEHEHIVAFEAILSPATAKYVHHYAILNNPVNDSWVQDHINNPTLCFSDVGFPTATWTVWGWGPGTPKMVFPQEAGMSTGVGTGVFAVTLQIHYDNPSLDSGITDDSGFRVTYTRNRRPHEIGTLTLGDVYVSAPDIPPGEVNYGYDFECPSNCTDTWPHDINVVASWMHMHQLGTQSLTTLHRKGAALEDYTYIHNVEFWDFNFQQTVAFAEPIVVQRGDRMNVHCYYNTLSRTEPTAMFIGSEDEMCVLMLYYYPRIPNMEGCGFYRFEEFGQEEPLTVCGTRSDVQQWTNPQIPDPPGVETRSFGVAPTNECASTGTYYCAAQWQCSPMTLDYNFAVCDNNRCNCKDGFSGQATTYSKCECSSNKFVSWVNGSPVCVDHGYCPSGGVWECSGTQDYNYVLCNQGQCVCRSTFQGSGTPSDPCRCTGTVTWSSGVPSCSN